jgi:16S rRNA processing protein RimM
MFEKKDSYKLGTILKPHGIHGEVVLKFDNYIEEKHYDLESILIDIDGGLVPFLFETLQQQTEKTMLVKLSLINTIEEAQELNNKSFYLSEIQVGGLAIPENKLSKEIEGFAVVDEKLGEVGIANDIIDYTNHSAIQAFQGKKEILIPFDPAIVLEIISDKKIVRVDLPEGLLVLND